ncbi:polysaccharide ABC transporter ATP-binding protein [Flavobacterium sp. GSA192]|uniref:ABC transporter ATP-binding protein n=1 Tax=Flavobacterium sp. GSA192 TaxID=2576304 RepID=UPI001129E7C9|nr:ABC transporter ATP-binding protein [Flavobacterium sp. GSA192]
MEAEVLIKAENVSKKFAKSLKKSLFYGVQDLISGITGRDQNKDLRKDEFWAVKDISFEVRRGECLGLIGHNGAGKSTLLKMLNGLIAPDEGTITIKGKIGALIELGAGFNPILSGRENIYNNAAVIGFTKKEIDQKLDAIIAFAELEEFIDMPVQNYSSGMKVRLGFAVAAQMEPDVLIIDEVLAVGDLGFMMKCYKTIDNLLKNTAIIYVSHSMPTVSRLCNNIILLERGESCFQGDDVGRAIDMYYTSFVDNDSNIIYTDETLELLDVKLLETSKSEDNIQQINWKEDLIISFNFKLNKKIEVPLFRILIYDKEQRPLAILEPNYNSNLMKVNNDYLSFKVQHSNIQLSKGIYFINITAFKRNSNEPILRINNVISFQIIHQEDHFQPFLLSTDFKEI